PMPCDAPVTSAILPCRFAILLRFPSGVRQTASAWLSESFYRETSRGGTGQRRPAASGGRHGGGNSLSCAGGLQPLQLPHLHSQAARVVEHRSLVRKLNSERGRQIVAF